jgi:DNA-binding MarR family transcriptional regulator
MATETEQLRETCAYVVGDDGLSRWSDLSADAWIGLLETHRKLSRELDEMLEAQYGLGLSGLEVLGRLAAAEDRRLRVSDLAQAAGLSVSRVSRLVDMLESRGLVQRQRCPGDGRAINALLTEAGLNLAREAQGSHFAAVQERFFNHLAPEEVATLATVFARFAPRGAGACTTD